MQVLRLRPSPAQRDSGSAQDDMNDDADSPAAAGPHGCPTHSRVSNVWETMDQLEAASLRLVVRQFTPTHSNVRNEWGTQLAAESCCIPSRSRLMWRGNSRGAAGDRRWRMKNIWQSCKRELLLGMGGGSRIRT